MIRPLQTYHPPPSRPNLRHLQRQIIGLRPGITKSHYRQLRRKLPQQLLSGLHQHIIDKPRIGLKYLALLLNPPYEFGMAMPDVRDVVDAVEILLAVLFVHEDAFGVLDFQRGGVVGD